MNQLVLRNIGAFFKGQTEKEDSVIYQPLSNFTWSRDLAVRNDITIGTEASSFFTEEYTGGVDEVSYAQDQSNAIQSLSVSATKTITPLYDWCTQADFTNFELSTFSEIENAGLRDIMSRKLKSVNYKWNLDMDRVSYVGDGQRIKTGLLNSDDKVTKTNIGSLPDPSADTDYAHKVIDKINVLLTKAWDNTDNVHIPSSILISPGLYSTFSSLQLQNTPMSVLQYICQNNIYANTTGQPLTINPVKWLRNIDDGKRLVVYTNDIEFVRVAASNLVSQSPVPTSTGITVSLIARLGGVEFVRPETMIYGLLK